MLLIFKQCKQWLVSRGCQTISFILFILEQASKLEANVMLPPETLSAGVTV